ncbi:hypothetical protein NLI96_g1227 [Meripilus lineatus]|uniref:SMP-LTD domain-containing protein n=1 Tax=Meripilus lineatus TaxID=2056292 RepID=A0AAD5VCE7_9APHY|nr:hypothetical protein NLI96_g1227 [Physisporinus lineatus]
MLDAALNKGNKPPVIADKIEVVELEMGTQPPELEIRDIGELTMDQFRGIFRLTYDGDAHIVLRTKVQANPLNHKQPDIHLMAGSRGMLAAKQPLVVPMLLRLSHFKLNSYVVLVVSRQKGITLVFKTDPLQNVDINSTFDSIAVIQKFIQKEIEGQLRQMFREDLPGIIHRLSQQWVKAKVEAPYLSKRPPIVRPRNVETASAPEVPGRMPPRTPPHATLSRSQSASVIGLGRTHVSSPPSVASASRKVSSTPSTPPPEPTPTPEGPTTFPFLEQFDPTYGLRPERIPTKSVFTSFRSLFTPNKGLADLKEEPSDIDDDEGTSFDASNWDDFLSESQYSTAPPRSSTSEYEDAVEEYETVPAVGGGTITRPRVIHSQSQVKIDTGDGPRSPLASSSSTRPIPPRLSTMSRSYDNMPPPHSAISHSFRSPHERTTPLTAPPTYNPYFAGATPLYDPIGIDEDEDDDISPHGIGSPSPFSRTRPRPYPLAQSPPPSHRPGSPSSVRTHLSRSSDATHSVPTPPHEGDDDAVGIRITRPHRPSFSNSLRTMEMDHQFYTHSGSPPDHYGFSGFGSPHLPEHDPTKIILKPAINNSVSRLSTLSHSNHTLSPYTRTLEHFTVRSVPPRESASSGSGSAGERIVKAKRKRIYRLGGKKDNNNITKSGSDLRSDFGRAGSGMSTRAMTPEPQSPLPPASEFDASDMDRYFRSRDDFVPRYPDIHPSHMRRRFSQYQSPQPT